MAPSVRWVQLGQAATAWAAVVNAGSETATQVSIALDGAPAGFSDFLYQTSDRAGNLLGSPNTPVDIPPGQPQFFFIAVTPDMPTVPTSSGPSDQAFLPSVLKLRFQGTNTPPAPTITDLNTLSVGASTTPHMDLIPVAATCPSDDDAGSTVNIPPGGTGAFSAAVVNGGAAGQVFVTATGHDVMTLICPTDPQTGACTMPPSGRIGPITFATGQVVTFSIFVRARDGAEPITFDPAANRISLRFDTLIFERTIPLNQFLIIFIQQALTSVAVRTHSPACAP